MRPPPIGVAVLGFFALVNGLGALIIGLRLMGFVTFGPAESGTGLFFWGGLPADTPSTFDDPSPGKPEAAWFTP